MRMAKQDKAVQLLGEALALAEPDGFIRIFVDEGPANGGTCCERPRKRGITPELCSSSYWQPLASWEAESAASDCALASPALDRAAERT